MRDPLELALSEFMQESRRGKAPTVEDYVLRFPDLADQIREFFPLVRNLERWKSEKEMECLRRSVPKQFPFNRLGDYELVRELGRGGMGVVFEGVHRTSHRSVAIKLLPWRFAADMPLWKERLQREAATIAALQHPNIVPIYSFSEDQGYYYYVMQLVDGVGLDQIIRQLKQERGKRRFFGKPESTAAAELTCDAWRGFAKIGEQIALALACAHARGVLHNDIKPSNLLVRSNGQVIVTDFGIGKSETSELSEANDLAIGTLRYMAPERLTGRSNPQSDIYSLGVTLYELATQQPLFDSQKRLELNEAILKQKPASPRRVVPEMPVLFERIILKAISKSPQDRYRSARAVAEDLRRFINRRPLRFAKQGIWQQAVSWFSGLSRFWRR